MFQTPSWLKAKSLQSRNRDTTPNKFKGFNIQLLDSTIGIPHELTNISWIGLS